MTEESIESLIDALNAGEMCDRIFRASLSATVDCAKVWPKEPVGEAGNEGSLDFFFIKNDAGLYVAAVFDMHQDFHVFVKEKFRGNGFLTKAMNDSVLPMLYQGGRKIQEVTFQDPKIGIYCAKHWGFSVTSETTAEKDLSAYADAPSITPKGTPVTREVFSQIKVKINRANLYLTMIKEQLDAAYGQCDETGLQVLLDDMWGLDDAVLSFIEDEKGLREG